MYACLIHAPCHIGVGHFQEVELWLERHADALLRQQAADDQAVALRDPASTKQRSTKQKAIL